MGLTMRLYLAGLFVAARHIPTPSLLLSRCSSSFPARHLFFLDDTLCLGCDRRRDADLTLRCLRAQLQLLRSTAGPASPSGGKHCGRYKAKSFGEGMVSRWGRR